MKRLRIYCFLLTQLLLIVLLNPNNGMSAINSANLNDDVIFNTTFDTKLNELRINASIPSISAAVVYDNETVWHKGYGDQPGTDIVYPIGSITKSLTASAVLSLYDEGSFDLDDDINNHYSGMTIRNPAFSSTPVTIRHLLSHTSSLIYSNFLPHLPDPWDPNHYPGQCFNYSNVNYWVLSELIEETVNMSYVNYMEENFFNSLEMSDTKFSYTDYNLNELADGFNWSYSTKQLIPMSKESDAPVIHLASGGARSTSGDIANFLSMQMNQGWFKGTPVLKNETILEMHTTNQNFHGLGWMTDINSYINSLGGTPFTTSIEISGKLGSSPGWDCFMVTSVTENVGIVVFLNLQCTHDLVQFEKVMNVISHILQNALLLEETTTAIEDTTTTTTPSSTNPTTTEPSQASAISLLLILPTLMFVAQIKKRKRTF